MEARRAPRRWEKNSARLCYDFQNSAGGAPVTWFYPTWEGRRAWVRGKKVSGSIVYTLPRESRAWQVNRLI